MESHRGEARGAIRTRLPRALWAVVRTLCFSVKEMKTFCKILSKAVT